MSEKREPSPCDFCDDPVCLDDFITGNCPAENYIEECGCEWIVCADSGDRLALVHQCEYHHEFEPREG